MEEMSATSDSEGGERRPKPHAGPNGTLGKGSSVGFSSEQGGKADRAAPKGLGFLQS